MSTPIYEALMAEQRPKNWIPAKRVEGWGEPSWPPAETLIITSTPKPAWRTFMRCLGWWKK